MSRKDDVEGALLNPVDIEQIIIRNWIRKTSRETGSVSVSKKTESVSDSRKKYSHNIFTSIFNLELQEKSLFVSKNFPPIIVSRA